eukprot:6010484-Amphidinium_carterae.1
MTVAAFLPAIWWGASLRAQVGSVRMFGWPVEGSTPGCRTASPESLIEHGADAAALRSEAALEASLAS